MKALAGLLIGVATLGASAAVTTVPAGGELTVTDDNVAAYADGIEFADAAGRVIFQTSSAPTMQLSGAAGCVVKDTSADWSLATAQAAFRGTWDFTAGTTTLAVKGALGPNRSRAKATAPAISTCARAPRWPSARAPSSSVTVRSTSRARAWTMRAHCA